MNKYREYNKLTRHEQTTGATVNSANTNNTNDCDNICQKRQKYRIIEGKQVGQKNYS
jgi:hypothetical protein